MTTDTHQPKGGTTFLAYMTRLGFSVLAVTLIGLVPATSWADKEGESTRYDPKRKVERMAKRLNLTEEQQAKILPILQEKQGRMREIHQQMKDVRQDAMAKIEEQLTPEQREKFQKAKETRLKKKQGCKDKHGKRLKKGRDRRPKMTFDDDEEDFQDPDSQ